MTHDAVNLANSLLLAGCGLRADGDKLLVSPPIGRALTEAQTSALRLHKPDLLALLKSSCPRCRRAIGKRGECWKCFTRPCEACGRETGSCFIACCIMCQPADDVPAVVESPKPVPVSPVVKPARVEPERVAKPRRKAAVVAGGMFD